MRLHRQIQLGVAVVALGFAVVSVLIGRELVHHRAATKRLDQDQQVARHAVRFERGARTVEAGAYMHECDRSVIARQLVEEGRAELVTASDSLSGLMRSDAMAADLADARGVAGAVLARAQAAMAAEITEDVRPRAGVRAASLESRAEALRLKIGELVDRADRAVEVSRRSVAGTEQRMRWLVFAGLAVFGVLGVAVAAFIARRIVARLLALVDGVERVGRHDLESPLPDLGADELGDVGRAFNRMAEDLERAERQLVETERLAAIGELAVTVRHEIGNPLQNLLGAVSIAREDPELLARGCDDLLEGMVAQVSRIADILGRLGCIESTATRTYVGDVKMLDLGQ